MVLKILVGIPASGKSTFAKTQQEAIIVSTDELRMQLFGDYNAMHSVIFDVARERIEDCLNDLDNICIIDATNLKKKTRKQWIDLAHRKNHSAVVEFFEIDLSTAKQRIKKRQRKVPPFILQNMWKGMQKPDYSEGMDKIITHSSFSSQI